MMESPCLPQGQPPHACSNASLETSQPAGLRGNDQQLLQQLLIMMKIQQFHVLLKPVFYLRTLPAAFGIVANIINVHTFLIMGLQDSVSIVLFNISISDLMFLVCIELKICIGLLQIVPEKSYLTFKIEPSVFATFVDICGPMFVVVTLTSTTFLAVQRCLCVLMPLKFKGIFTRLRTQVVQGLIWSYSAIGWVPMLMALKLDAVEHPFDANRTILRLGFVGYGTPAYKVLDTLSLINGPFVSGSCQVTLIVCVILMTRALRKSVQFRKASTTTTTHQGSKASQKDVEGRVESELDQTKTKAKEDASKDSSGTGIGSAKERQVIVQVALISTIFICTHLPNVGGVIAHRLLVLFGYEYFGSVYMLASEVYRYFDIFLYIANASLNIFVYVKYNSKFRQCFYGQLAMNRHRLSPKSNSQR